MGTKLFVVAGSKTRGTQINSIEMLEFNERGPKHLWQLITIPLDVLSARTNPLLCNIGRDRLVIMGGYTSGRLSDVISLDCSEHTAKKIMPDGSCRFDFVS